MNRNNRVLITGGSGFMGMHLITLLLEHGYNVLSVDKKENTLIGDYQSEVCNILDANNLCNIFNDFLPEIVVHLAARIDLNETEDINGYADNIDGVQNLVNAINSAGSVNRLLVTSSQLVSKVGHVQKHEYDYCPNNLYGESKVLTEAIVREADLPGVTWCILRPTTIWGEGVSSHYQRFLRMVMNSRYFHIGNSPLYKSYGYVRNSMFQYVRFIEADAKKIHSNVFYISDYEPLSIVNWANLLAHKFGAKKIKSMPIFIARSLGYIGDMVNFIGFKK